MKCSVVFLAMLTIAINDLFGQELLQRVFIPIGSNETEVSVRYDELTLLEPTCFDVDSDGNYYILSIENDSKYIKKYSSNGLYLSKKNVPFNTIVFSVEDSLIFFVTKENKTDYNFYKASCSTLEDINKKAFTNIGNQITDPIFDYIERKFVGIFYRDGFETIFAFDTNSFDTLSYNSVPLPFLNESDRKNILNYYRISGWFLGTLPESVFVLYDFSDYNAGHSVILTTNIYGNSKITIKLKNNEYGKRIPGGTQFAFRIKNQKIAYILGIKCIEYECTPNQYIISKIILKFGD